VHSLFSVENPLMDVIAHVDFDFLVRFKKQPGTMHLVEFSEVSALLREIHSFHTAPGGSAANTARGISWLRGAEGRVLGASILGSGARCPEDQAPVFNGAIGADPRGDQFLSYMEEAGVRTALVRKDVPTGTSVILVTPDGERTMNTYLGACRAFEPSDLDLALLADAHMLYLTGYLWDTENQRLAAEKAGAFARDNGRGIVVAFDLADPFAVRRYSAQFRAWIPGRVDVLFGNRDELSLLTGTSCDEDCIESASSFAPIVAMKVGEKGCLVSAEGRIQHVPGVSVKPVDTTGAGDAFAAGFLYARLCGADPFESGRLANAVAARVVTMEGASYV
jgi:sugar/nucleoside kinase (ribokinase family)